MNMVYYNGVKERKSHMKYIDNDAFIIEVEKAILESGFTKRKIAEALDMSPQNLNKLLNKKNFSMADAKKILDVIGFEIEFEIKRK
jgi:hypothetical protein